MAREHQRKFLLGIASVACVTCVATSAVSPLSAQARAAVEVSVTVLAPLPDAVREASSADNVNRYASDTNDTSTQLAGGVARVWTKRSRDVDGQALHPVVVTLEYAAN